MEETGKTRYEIAEEDQQAMQAWAYYCGIILGYKVITLFTIRLLVPRVFYKCTNPS